MKTLSAQKENQADSSGTGERNILDFFSFFLIDAVWLLIFSPCLAAIEGMYHMIKWVQIEVGL